MGKNKAKANDTWGQQSGVGTGMGFPGRQGACRSLGEKHEAEGAAGTKALRRTYAWSVWLAQNNRRLGSNFSFTLNKKGNAGVYTSFLLLGNKYYKLSHLKQQSYCSHCCALLVLTVYILTISVVCRVSPGSLAHCLTS